MTTLMSTPFGKAILHAEDPFEPAFTMSIVFLHAVMICLMKEGHLMRITLA